MNDTCIIYQGSDIYSDNLNHDFENIIYSTWEDQTKFDIFKNVIKSKYPNDYGSMNVNLQKQSTITGLKAAKDLGFKYALKIRSDIKIQNFEKIFKNKRDENIHFLCWHGHQVYPNCKGYFIDYIQFGSIDNLLKLWENVNINYTVVPEIMLVDSFLKNDLTAKYFLPDINDGDLYWLKRTVDLNSYKLELNNDPNNMFCFKTNVIPNKDTYFNF